MRLLKIPHDLGQLSHVVEYGEYNIPPYAILSHRWEHDEVRFEDVGHENVKEKAGYAKILFCAEQARRAGIDHLWVDTCCINMSNSSELSEAINSMFRWFQNAAKCYVYLSDVSSQEVFDRSAGFTGWESQFRMSSWFTRCWTIQELLAPRNVEFFSAEGELLGNKTSLVSQIHEITRIPVTALLGERPLDQFSIGERLSWSQRRKATRGEDVAYSLFGIFDVNLPLIYGEGEQKAMRRLLMELDTTRVSLGPSTEEKIYQQLRQSDIRILILNPALEGTEITGYIQKFNLSEHPDYHALSYTWGDEPPIHRIDINHRQVFIRPNLYHALQRMRAHTYPVFLWIDSLCINQSNETEKNAQVQRMAEIYHRAKSVWIWLGEGTSSSAIAMDLAYKVAQNQYKWTDSWWEDYSFTAFNQILERPWFTRRWVIQEAAFAAKSIILCGDRQIDLDDFVHAVNVVRTMLVTLSEPDAQDRTLWHRRIQRRFSRKIVPSPGGTDGISRHEARSMDKSRSIVEGKTIPSMQSLSNFRDSHATRLLSIIEDAFERSLDETSQRRKLSLEVLVDLATFCETKDDRDTIFSLLSLANDARLSTSLGDTNLLTADYSSNTLDVFARFVMHCCLHSGSADVLCRPWAPVSTPSGHARNHVSRDYKVGKSTWPSWVACKDGFPFGNPSLRSLSRLHGTTLVGSSLKRVYNAHIDTKPQVRFGQQYQSGVCNGSLFIKGVSLGRITQRSTRMAGAIITKECVEILAGRCFDVPSGPGNVPDAVWRTLCADRDSDGTSMRPEHRSAMLQILQLGSEAEATSSQPYRIVCAPSVDVEALLGTKVPEDFKRVLETIRNVTWNRRTFRGKHHGDGSVLVGLAPQFADVGDYICILYGCSVPVVLRRHSRDQSRVWQLIGEAYVDTFMDGTGFSRISDRVLRSLDTEFEIC